MKQFILPLLALLSISGSVLAQSLSPDTIARLQERTTYWESYGELCQGFDFPSKNEENGTCDDGDSVIFNGLLCSSGNELGCQAVRNSLDENGQWWRSPRQVGGNFRDNNSFSRDQSMGVQLYLFTTNDKEAARRWMSWVEGNKHSLEYKSVKLGKASRLCHDEKEFTCLVTPGVWENLGRVWNAIGLEPTGAMRNPYKQFGDLGNFLSNLAGDLGYDWEDISKFEIRNAKPGYQYHLKGVQAYLAKRINEEAGLELYQWRAVALDLYRRQPNNLFFRYLAEGSSEAFAHDLISRCPAEGVLAPKRQWAWERADENEAWQKSMGWDCVFLSNLMLGKDRKIINEQTLSEPIEKKKLRVIERQSFNAPLYLVGNFKMRERYLIDQCTILVDHAMRTVEETTGIFTRASKLSVQNLRMTGSDSMSLQGTFDCHYEIAIVLN